MHTLNPMVRNERQSRFFSLKWKAVLILSLVLIIVNAGLAGMGYQQLKKQFARQQNQLRQQQTQELNALINNSFDELEQIASLIPSMAPPLTAPESMPARLAKVFADQSATLEFDWGLDEASYFSAENLLLFSWRRTENIERFTPMIEEVNASERPDFRLDCLNQCRQYIAVPVLSGGEKNGVLLLSRLISNVIISFKDITGADIAIISRETGKYRKSRYTHLLPGWGRHVVALTDPDNNLPLLIGISAQHPFDDFLHKSRQLDHNGKHYTLQTIQMNHDGSDSNNHYLLINNITSAVQHINEATQKSLLFGLIGFLLSESLLLLLLWHPLKRLLQVSQSLPLLAHNAYEQARARLKTDNRSWHKDEIDIAGETTLELSRTLEYSAS